MNKRNRRANSASTVTNLFFILVLGVGLSITFSFFYESLWIVLLPALASVVVVVLLIIAMFESDH